MPEKAELPPGILAIPVRGMGAEVTNCYAVTGTDGSMTLIDPGIRTAENWVALAEWRDAISSVIVTHLHPDHLGLAALIREQTGATVALHTLEQAAINTLSDGPNLLSTLVNWGVPATMRPSLIGDAGVSGGTNAFTADRFLEHGDDLGIPGHPLEVLWTPGHTPGHICLVDRRRRVLFSGDHVLPSINAGLGLAGEPRADVLPNYRASLDALAEFGDYAVAPGHGPVFVGLRERVEQIRSHQERRARAVGEVLAEHPDSTVWEVTAALPWGGGERPTGYRLFAALRQVDVHMAAYGR